MSGRFLPFRASRIGKKPTANKRTLRPEPLEQRMMLSAEDITHAILPDMMSGAWVSTSSTSAPQVSHAAIATVTGKTATISVLGSDSAGESTLRYTWSVTSMPAGGNVSFAANGTNGAKNDTATFNEAGSYGLKATITDAHNVSVTSTTTVIVASTLTSIRLTDATTHAVISPSTPVSINGTSETIIAQGLDQYGNVMATQPNMVWSTISLPSGASRPTIAVNGSSTTITFSRAGTYGISAQGTSGSTSLVGTATLTVNPVGTSFTFASGTALEVKGASVQVTVSQFLDQFHNPLATQPTITWSAASVPSGARTPSFSLSGKTVTVNFSKAGNYVLMATMFDATGHAASQYVTVLVDQVATSLAAATSTTVTVNGTSQQFANRSVLDQFGNAMTVQPAYTWSATVLPSGAQAPTFSTSGSTTTATFSKAGSYTLRAYVTSASSIAFTTSVVVNQTLTSVTVSPAATSVQTSGTDPITAQGFDQFHNLLSSQPSFTWSANAGTINTAGLFTAPGSSATVTVTAKSGSISGTATVTVGSAVNVKLGLTDTTLANLVQSLDADGSINRSDMMQILRSVGTSGKVSATDFADLKTIIGADATLLAIPSYVQILAGDVVNGNAANAHYQGQALGNLAVGSTSTQLTELVNKWFMGTDVPGLCNTSLVYTSVAGSLFPHTPSHNDEFQGMMGDCYFFSAMGTLADRNPAAVENMFLNNGDGTYTVRFYTGTYGTIYNYSDGSISAGFNNNIGTADYVTVNTMLPTSTSGMLVMADYGASASNPNNSLWLPLAEKAYAQWNETGKEGRDGTNTYSATQGGWMATVQAQVLGHNATDYIMTSTKEAVAVNALAAGKAVTIGTSASSKSDDSLPYGLYGSHAYAIIGYSASTDTFSLYNPWGFDQPSALTWAQLQTYSTQLCVCDTSSSPAPISTSLKSTLVKTSAVGLSAPATPDAAASALSDGSSSSSHSSVAAIAQGDAAAVAVDAIRGTSTSVATDATQAVFDHLGTGSDLLTSPQFHTDSLASNPLAAVSVDELFSDVNSVCEGALVG